MSATAIRSETAIRFDQVSKGFGETMALDDVSLDVPRGAFVTVIGSSGCGKTTLLKTVNALVVPDEGHVLVNGRDTAEADPIELRRSIGYAIQGSVLFPHLTVEQQHRLRAEPAEQEGHASHRRRRGQVDGNRGTAGFAQGPLPLRTFRRTSSSA